MSVPTFDDIPKNIDALIAAHIKQYLSEPEKAHLWVDPLTAAQMDAILKTGYSTPTELVEFARQLLKRAAN